MKSLANWLKRLALITGEAGPKFNYFRVFVSGNKAIDIDSWLFTIDPQHSVSSESEFWSVLRLPEPDALEMDIKNRHRFAVDLACVLSLALERRVIVPIDIPVPSSAETIEFFSLAEIVDQGIQAPIPVDAKSRVINYVTAIAGLSSEDQDIIGAASTAYYGALLLFDREPRAAYTLLITGIELLSRKYGNPPTNWHEWELSKEWDTLFDAQGLSSEQRDIFRTKLLKDKYLRLSMTFQDYASSRILDSFWDKPLDQWINGIDASTGERLPGRLMKARKVSDFIQKDRAVLKNRLKKSYDLRSSVVHQSCWLDLIKLGQFTPNADQLSSLPLSFPILRILLAELIWIEISERSTSAELPNFQLFRAGKYDI
ncbi:MAG: hypothetical protein A4S08_12115 [Proteobacteria bacterium SG_bin4]|nr:MAG: hypothetical protein A4S08_12115 [Proteobacteria bacterium SG_bin4]